MTAQEGLLCGFINQIIPNANFEKMSFENLKTLSEIPKIVIFRFLILNNKMLLKF